jgi:hypothetical protein
MLLLAGCAAFGLTKMFLSNPLQPRASSVVGLSVEGLSVDGLSVVGQSGVPYQTTSRQGGGARLHVSVCADLKHDDQSLLVPHVPSRHVTSLALGRVDLAAVGADGLEYAIELENIGESSLCKLRLLPSCGCSKAGLEADVLLPHATTTGRVRIHPRLAGAQSTKISIVAQWWGARITFTMPANSDSIVRDLGREAQLGELLRLSAVGVPAQVFAYSANSETTRN